MRVVFAGTPEPALPALEAIAASRHELVGVVTRPDAPAGRGPPAHALARSALRAEELGVPVLKPDAPARPGVPGGAAGAGPGLLPGGRVRRPAAAVGPRHPRRTAG